MALVLCTDEEDYMSIYEDAESVKNYMTSLLSRGSIDAGTSPEMPVTTEPSTLEAVARLGTAGRKLWSEMPQVKTGSKAGAIVVGEH